MAWPYQYTPHIWPVVTSGCISAALGIYGMRRRTAPGAFALSIMAFWILLWVLANGLVLVSRDDAARLFWFKAQVALVLPMLVAELCFSLEYAGLVRWLTPRSLALLALVPLAFALLVSTDELHHLVWTRSWFDGTVHLDRGPVHWVAIGYGYFLSLLCLMVLAWLFARSPQHRWIAAGLMAALLSMQSASLFNVANINPVAPLNPMVLVLNLALLPFAVAILRFRMFDVVPIAREAAVECMADGMLVLDVEERVADLNNTVQTLLGVSRSEALGKRLDKILAAHPKLLECVRAPEESEGEVLFNAERSYRASSSPIIDRRGFRLGRLITLHDVTDQHHAQGRLIDQERALAALRERELLARELHDGIGQMAAAAHLQVKCARELLPRGDTAQVELCLHSLAEITQELKESVRTKCWCSPGEKSISRRLRT